MSVPGLMRRMLALTAVVLGVTASCTGDPAEPPTPRADPIDPGLPSGSEALERFEEAVCELPLARLRRIARGYHPERSGEIQVLPEEPHFIGAWFSHSGPWGYVQRVPMFLYGPGHVPSVGPVSRPATVADLAPTIAEHLRFDFRAPDGAALQEASTTSGHPPRLVLVLVWDSVGINVLEEHPHAWPTLRSLIPDGVWFEDATVGSSPSVTPSIHATIGTGAFPATHGLSDMVIRMDGDPRGALSEGPDDLLVPALAEEYDAAMDGEPLIGLVAWKIWHLPLVGKGSTSAGPSRPIALLRNGDRWGIPDPNAAFYRTPRYPNDVEGWSEELRRLDLEDGELDREWLGERLDAGRAVVERLPAFTAYQTRVIQEVVRHEGFGRDDVADLLFVNFNEADKVGHRWSMNSPNMEAVVRSTDAALGRLIALLDREVGRGRWVVAVTADHGSTPHPNVSGATVIDNKRLAQYVAEEFGPGVLEQTRVTQLWLDTGRLRADGRTPAEVADHIAGYTKGDNAAGPSEVPEEERDDRLFAAAFPSVALETAPCLSEG